MENFLVKEGLVSESEELGSHHLVLYKTKNGRVEDWQMETVRFYLQAKCFVSVLALM